MSSNFINQLLSFIITPLGLISILLGLMLAFFAQRSRRSAWFLFTLCCFAASLSIYQDEFIQVPPALVFPLQEIREAGRPLTMVLLSILLLLGLQSQSGWRQKLIPNPARYLLVVQFVIMFKTLLYGSISFAFLAALTFGAVVWVIRSGPSRWLQEEKDFELATWSFAMVGVIFLVVNGYQAMFDLYPITFTHGRFLGTTGNPQHAAVLLSTIIPCIMFLIEAKGKSVWQRISWIVLAALVMGVLLLTGSRTGVLMGISTILLFYRHRIGKLLQVGLLVCIVLAIVILPFNQGQSSWDAVLTLPLDRYTSTDNSRATVWSALWQSFQTYPIFGVPLSNDRLMGYGESSWLGTAAALGLAGLIPLALFALACVQMVIKLFKLSNKNSAYFFQSSTIIAGLAAIFVGSIFEAFLLGNLAFPVLVLLSYLSLGQYLLESAEREVPQILPLAPLVRRDYKVARINLHAPAKSEKLLYKRTI